MKMLFLLLATFFVVEESGGGLVWLRTDDIDRMYREYEGTRIKLLNCEDIVVIERPGIILERMREAEE